MFEIILYIIIYFVISSMILNVYIGYYEAYPEKDNFLKRIDRIVSNNENLNFKSRMIRIELIFMILMVFIFLYYIYGKIKPFISSLYHYYKIKKRKD